MTADERAERLRSEASKYDWDITTDGDYSSVIEVAITRWLYGG